jgi:hypothetical protein
MVDCGAEVIMTMSSRVLYRFEGSTAWIGTVVHERQL